MDIDIRWDFRDIPPFSPDPDDTVSQVLIYRELLQLTLAQLAVMTNIVDRLTEKNREYRAKLAELA